MKKNVKKKIDINIVLKEKRKARDLRKSQWWKNLRAKNVCYYCEVITPAKQLTMDHVVPLTRGGKSIKSNLVPCCKSCNNEKKNLLPIEWKKFVYRTRKK